VRHDLQKVTELCLEEVLDCLGVLANVLLLHETVFGVLNELAEADHQAPWIWSWSLEALQENACNLLLDDLCWASFGIDKQNNAGEVESVVVWVSKLIHDSIQET